MIVSDTPVINKRWRPVNSGKRAKRGATDAHSLENGLDEITTISGTVEIIDSAGTRVVNALWVHKIYFSRDASGKLLVSRDSSSQRIPQIN